MDGVFTADPMKDPTARRYTQLGFDEALNRKLGVMDATALVMCRDNNIPLRVFNINTPGDLLRLARGEDVGTLVTNDNQVGRQE